MPQTHGIALATFQQYNEVVNPNGEIHLTGKLNDGTPFDQTLAVTPPAVIMFDESIGNFVQFPVDPYLISGIKFVKLVRDIS